MPSSATLTQHEQMIRLTSSPLTILQSTITPSLLPTATTTTITSVLSSSSSSSTSTINNMPLSIHPQYELAAFEDPLCMVPLKVKPKLTKSISLDRRSNKKCKLTISATTSPEKLAHNHNTIVRKTIGRFCTFQKMCSTTLTVTAGKTSTTTVSTCAENETETTKASKTAISTAETILNDENIPYLHHNDDSDLTIARTCVDYYV